MTGFKPGDVVWIGLEGDPLRKATWKILSLHQATDQTTYATLSSGRTERLQTVPTTRLTKFRVLEPSP